MLAALLAGLVLGLIGLRLDESKILAAVGAGGSVLAMLVFLSAC